MITNLAIGFMFVAVVVLTPLSMKYCLDMCRPEKDLPTWADHLLSCLASVAVGVGIAVLAWSVLTMIAVWFEGTAAQEAISDITQKWFVMLFVSTTLTLFFQRKRFLSQN